MARENTVFLYGIVEGCPKVRLTSEGEPVVARVKLKTVRRSYINEEMRLRGEIRTDIQYVISRNQYLIEHHMINIKAGDLLFVKGSMSSRNVNKSKACPKCGCINTFEGTSLVYVDPIFITSVKNTLNDPEAEWNELRSSAEISNCCFIYGNLCNEPLFYSDDRKIECSFQIASNRKRRIAEDGAEHTADFPYVRTFGPKSKEYSEALHTGSEIYINGSIQSREYTVDKVCAGCNSPFSMDLTTMEIVPYSIEYIRNCIFPDAEESSEG